MQVEGAALIGAGTRGRVALVERQVHFDCRHVQEACEREAGGTGADDGDFRNRGGHSVVGFVLNGTLTIDSLASGPRSEVVAAEFANVLAL